MVRRGSGQVILCEGKRGLTGLMPLARAALIAPGASIVGR
jgi:hypothetical protein